MMRTHNARLRRGATVSEVMIASVISAFVVLGSLLTYVAGIDSWGRGLERIDVETDSQRVVKVIANELREAMVVAIDPDGQGLTYFIPEILPSGDFRTDGRGQPVSDGVARRIFHDDGEIVLNNGEADRILARNVILTDPDSTPANLPYKIFTPNAGQMVRQVTVMVVSRRTSHDGQDQVGRKRETVFLRNVLDTQR